MKKVKYDIFISYRREAYNTANLIAEKLRNAGYSVFFDIDTLTSGKFNEQLINVISECKDRKERFEKGEHATKEQTKSIYLR